MSKIQTIKIENFKAITQLEANFKGCTAIITGGNNKGKTSFLRGIPDRIRFVRPEVMVKAGSTKGKGEMTLDTGERFIWEFNTEGQDKLTLITKEGAKRNVTTEIGKQFFPTPFDIDRFLNSSPKEQSKQLQKVINLDFSDIDKRYAEAYQNRTDKNREAEKHHAKITAMLEVPYVKAVDISKLVAQKEAERNRLNNLYKQNKESNDALRAKYREECLKIDNECREYNDKQRSLTARYDRAKSAAYALTECGYAGEEVNMFLSELYASVSPEKIPQNHYPTEPTYIPEMPDDSDLRAIDEQILEASVTNQRAAEYENYVAYKQQVEQAKTDAEQADAAVKAIEKERAEMLQKAKLPKGIELTSDGLTVDGLPLDRTQLSSSRITIAALQIAALNMGEVKTLFFDASYLDRNSLSEVNTWAEQEGLQLLIERPDFDGGEISYNLIEN